MNAGFNDRLFEYLGVYMGFLGLYWRNEMMTFGTLISFLKFCSSDCELLPFRLKVLAMQYISLDQGFLFIYLWPFL